MESITNHTYESISSMTVIAHFTLPSDTFELGQVLSYEGVQVEITQFVSLGEAVLPYFWVNRIDDMDGFEQAVRADERVASFTPLNGKVGKALYQLEWTDQIDGLMEVLSNSDIIVENAFGTAEKWEFHIRGHDRDALSTFQKACAEHGLPIDITRVHDNPDESDESSLYLTEKQHKAVALAFGHGYFAVPREISLSELAEKVGISRQAYSRRLQRGLSHILENSLSVDKEDK